MSKAVATAAPHDGGLSIAPMIERIITDASLPMERVEQAFAFYQKVQADQARKAWATAFVAMQNDLEPIVKDAKNKQTNSKYATHAALDKGLRPIYTRHGFAISFNTSPSDQPEHIKVICDLIHQGGHERRYEVVMPADGKGAKGGDVMSKTHAAGSAVSYGKRYLLIAAFNLALLDSDDDGNAAGGLETITGEQAEELSKLISATGTDLAKFLQVAKAESVSDVLSKDYARLTALLLKKRAQK